MMKLYIDIDGTITDTIKQVITMYNSEFGESMSVNYAYSYDFKECELLTNEKIKEYFANKMFYTKDILFDSNIPLYLEKLSHLYNIVFVTIGSEKNITNKKKWLKRLLNFEFDFIGLHEDFYNDKSSVDMSDGMFIDDVAKNLETSNAAYKIVYGEEYSWNEACNYYRCYNWKEVYKSLVIKAIYVDDGDPEVKITFNTIDKLKEFCNAINKYECSAIAIQGLYRVDAGSMLGMLSLDIMKPITISLIELTDRNKRNLEAALFDLKEIFYGYSQDVKGQKG